jgi:hypothetical protein
MKYIGEFKNGTMEGTGTHTWPDGRKYIGDWKNNKREGTGTHTWPSGQKYIGEYKNDKKEGTGTYTWPDGMKYIGDYKNGLREGTGTYTWPKEVSISGEGYNQTYIILKHDKIERVPGAKAAADSDSVHDVFFRCGNWCYRGPIQFNGMQLGTADLPIIIPNIATQQGSLTYFCNSKSVPKHTIFYDQLQFVNQAIDFLGSEISSDRVDAELRKMSSAFPWIDDPSAKMYFELVCTPPACMRQAALIASKTYLRGLIIISVFYENTLYVVVADGEGSQPMLDVRFPDVSSHGDGVHLASYNDADGQGLYDKLTLWHSLSESN